MPFYFILSGFSCTLGYGQRQYSEIVPFKSLEYYFGRWIRIIPVYYFCLFFHSLLIFFDCSYYEYSNITQNVGGFVTSLFCVQTWTLYFGLGPNRPAWTVSTLLFFYISFFVTRQEIIV